MFFKYFYFISCIFIGIYIDTTNGGMTKDKMYEKIDGNAACFRRLNGTHQVGCTSRRQGSTGIVHIANTPADIDSLLKNGTAGPYMPLIPPQLFTRDILTKLKNHFPEQISGVIMRNDTTIPMDFSHDYQCPNPRSSLNGTCDAASGGWNPLGSGLLFEEFPFPIFLITNDTDVKKITDCYEKFNSFDFFNQRFRSLCAIELKAFMFATTDSKTCIRRTNIVNNLKPVKFCDPLGDQNVYGLLLPRGNYSVNDTNNKPAEVVDNKSSEVIVVATRLDDTSMFDGVTPGASSPISGLVTLLSTAYLLKQMINSSDSTVSPKKNILFVIFNGESYDYIGSQRIVYDMNQNKFPMEYDSSIKYNVPNITLDDISLFIELSQLSVIDNLNMFHMEYTNTTSQTNIDNFISTMKKNLIKMTVNETKNTIPPSSLQSFLINNTNVPGVVLADHSMQFHNKYYHSIYDNAANIQFTYYNSSLNQTSIIPPNTIQSHLSTVSVALAKTLFEILNDGKSVQPAQQFDTLALTDELLYCYLISPNCKIFRAATFQEVLKDTQLPLYVGVDEWLNSITTVTGYTLAYFIGDILPNVNKPSCVFNPQMPLFRFQWVNGDINESNTTGVCLKSTVHFTRAKSPAFDIEDYDWTSGQYSTWTESIWKELTVQIFLKPSAQHENITITIGTVVLVLSFIVVYITNKRADVLFNTNSNIIGTSC